MMRRVLPLAILLFSPHAFASDVALTKEAGPSQAFQLGEPVHPLYPGEGIMFFHRVENRGATAANGIVVTDVLPADVRFAGTIGVRWTCTGPTGFGGTVTCSLPTLAPGAHEAFTIINDIRADFPAPGTIANTATVTTATPDPNIANNSSTAAIGVFPRPVPGAPALSPLALALLAAALALIALVSTGPSASP